MCQGQWSSLIYRYFSWCIIISEEDQQETCVIWQWRVLLDHSFSAIYLISLHWPRHFIDKYSTLHHTWHGSKWHPRDSYSKHCHQRQSFPCYHQETTCLSPLQMVSHCFQWSDDCDDPGRGLCLLHRIQREECLFSVRDNRSHFRRLHSGWVIETKWTKVCMGHLDVCLRLATYDSLFGFRWCHQRTRLSPCVVRSHLLCRGHRLLNLQKFLVPTAYFCVTVISWTCFSHSSWKGSTGLRFQ